MVFTMRKTSGDVGHFVNNLLSFYLHISRTCCKFTSYLKLFIMTLQYISGFFDADGSISMSKSSKNDTFKGIKLDFTNTYITILEEIQKYLLDEYDIKTHLSKKPARSKNHNISYCLSSNSNQNSLKLCKLLNSRHPKKLHRINTVLKYHDVVTMRNGKYTDKQVKRKLAYERLFFLPTFL